MAPTGAFHSQYDEDLKYNAKARSLKHKFYALNRMPDIPFEHFLSRKPEMVSWPSTKYEWGKMRAIYGVDITNFIMCCYSMAGCEELLSTIFPIGPSATEENVKSTVKGILRSGVPFCFDFEDFNSQHSLSSMQAVLAAYANVYDRDLHPEQIAGIAWISKALESMYVKTEQGDYKANGTLMSGWRLTTFMNTVLNYVYVKLIYGNKPMASTHNGDDVLSAVKTFSDVQTLMKGAKARNVRFQRQKCFLASIAEFLRIDHGSSSGGQYLARATATMVHGPTETIVPNDLLALIKSTIKRAEEMMERGAARYVTNTIVAAQLKHLAKLWDMSYDDLWTIVNTHQIYGGVTEIVNNITLAHDIEMIEDHIAYDPKIEDDSNATFPGVVTYAKRICRRMVDQSYIGHILTAAKRAILRNAVTKRFRCSVKTARPDATRSLQAAQNGIYRKFAGKHKVDIAKAYGIPITAISLEGGYLEQILNNEKDVVKAVKIYL